MLRNLPETHKGSTSPLLMNLEKGMCVEIQYNGGILRRGIVYEDPALTMTYMWWQTNTRYVRGEVPRCTTLHEGIPKDRIPGLTIEPVAYFESWLASVPFSIRLHFGEVKRGGGRKPKTSHEAVNTTPPPNQRPKLTAPAIQGISDVRDSDSALPLSRAVIEEPPWSEPRETSDPPWTPPFVVVQTAPEPSEGSTKRKVRCDKDVKRGSRCKTPLMMEVSQETVPENGGERAGAAAPPVPFGAQEANLPVDVEFRNAIVVLAKFVGTLSSAFGPQN